MALKITDHQARFLRMSSQRLLHDDSPPSQNGAQVVKEVVGIQAQEQGAAFLSIQARNPALRAGALEHEFLVERTMIRSWFMRGTLHMVATEDVEWLLPLLSPFFIQQNQRRYKELGLDESSLILGVKIIRETLASHGPMTRQELAPYLTGKGINTQGQALIYLINRAALEGVLCLGPEVEGKQAYVLWDDWVGQDLKNFGKGGLGQFVERYLGCYGPASPPDFAAWSGLPLGRVRETWIHLEDRLIEIEFSGGYGFILSEQAPLLEEPYPDWLGVQLLPKFDTFLLGYKQRGLFIAPEHATRVNAGGGILRAVLLVNGSVQGTWKMVSKGKGVIVQVDPFTRLSPAARESLEVKVEGIGQFLGLEAALELVQLGVNNPAFS
jgi:hypothetical protein